MERKNYMIFIMISHFYLKRKKIEKVEKLEANLHDKTEYAIHIRNKKKQSIKSWISFEEIL